MGPVDAISTCFRKSFTFSGRASRTEFWWFYAFSVLVAAILANVISAAAKAQYVVASTIVMIPMCAAATRRVQDVGRPGYQLALLVLVFAIGFTLMSEALPSEVGLSEMSGARILLIAISWIICAAAASILLIWLRRPSQPGPNKYGPNPHEVTP